MECQCIHKFELLKPLKYNTALCFLTYSLIMDSREGKRRFQVNYIFCERGLESNHYNFVETNLNNDCTDGHKT